MNSMRMIFKYWAKSKKQFVVQFIFLLLTTFFYTLIPIFIGRMVGALANVNDLLINFLLVVVFALLLYFANRTARLKGAEVSSRAIYH